MAAQREKVYQCLTCKQDIKLARKDDNTGWLRFNLDGTPHVDERKNKKQQKQSQVVTMDNGPQMAELAKQVSDLKDTVNILVSQITMHVVNLRRNDIVNRFTNTIGYHIAPWCQIETFYASPSFLI